MNVGIDKRAIGAAVVGAVLLGGTAAMAGYKTAWEVYVYKNADGSGWADGNMAAARASADTNQELRCTVTSAQVTCYAWDATRKLLSCWSQDAAMMNAARALNSDSGLEFSVNASGVCTQIYVYNWSSFAPKTP